MKFTFAVASALMGGIALAAPQAVTSAVSPTGAAPAGCTSSFSGSFEISVVTPSKKRDLAVAEKRDTCGGDGILVLTLKDGVLTDAKGRTGYIASNFQFQFDAPPQAGAIYTAGYSVCPGNVLALGSNETWYECLSGSFYNLYDRSWAAQCQPVEIVASPCGGSGVASQGGDGQVVGTTLVQTTIVTALSDGQPQVHTTSVPIALCQITDGQVQVHTTPCASITTTYKATTTAAPVSQYSDGQIQVTPPASTTPAAAPTTKTAAPTTAPTSAPASAPASSYGNSTIVASTSATLLSTAPGSSAPAASSPAATTSAPASSGSSRMATGSVVALLVGLMVAFVSL